MSTNFNAGMTKALRLVLAALVTVALCSTVFFVTKRDQAYWTYRCIKYATSVSSCFTGGDFAFTTDLFGMVYEGNTGNYIDKRIFYLGAYEKPLLFVMRDLMKSASGDQGVFVDVGANTGQHSLFMSRYSKTIHAFEPYEPVLRRFRRMIEINRIRNIVVHPVGLGNADARLPFYRPPESNLATGSFVEKFRPDNSPLGELEIQIGDEALRNAGVRSVNLIKIDIEGYEKLALQGLRKTLRDSRPFVIFELTTDPQSAASVKSKRELIGLFPQDYAFSAISEDGGLITGEYQLVDLDTRVHFDRSEQNNVLAYPTEKKRHLALGRRH